MANLPPAGVPPIAGDVPLVPAAQEAAQAIGQPLQVTTYSQWYSNALNDPFGQNYGPVLACFRANRDMTSDMLLQQVLQATSVPQAFLVGSHSARAGYRFYVLHRPARYESRLDGAVSQWDGRTFAYQGDIMYGTMCIVEFPADPFGFVEGVRAYSIAAINEFYAQQPNLQLLLPAPAEEARADRIETRRMMYLPAKYAPLLLDAKGYTAQEVWARLIPALEMDQKLEECQILVDWLRVAITAVPDEQEAGGQLLIRSPLTNAGELFVPMADRELLEQRQRIISHDLPGRHRMEHGLEGSILQLANAVANNTRDAHEARLAREEERGRDKLPS